MRRHRKTLTFLLTYLLTACTVIGLQVLPDLAASTAWLVLPAYRAGREILVRVDLKAQRDFLDLPETLVFPADKETRDFRALRGDKVSVFSVY